MFLSFLLLNCAQKSDKDIPPKGIEDSLNVYLQKVMTRFKIPGLAVAIIKDGTPLYTHAFGVKNVDTNEKLGEKDIFHFASVSKPFVATAVMQLVEQRKMVLDEKITHYLPYFKLDDERYQEITIPQGFRMFWIMNGINLNTMTRLLRDMSAV